MKYVRLLLICSGLLFFIYSCDGVSEAEKKEMEVEGDIDDKEIPPQDDAAIETKRDKTKVEPWGSDELPPTDTSK